MRDCDEALKLQPGNMDARDTRGFIYLKLGDFPVSINEYNASLQARSEPRPGAVRPRPGEDEDGDKQGGSSDMAAAVNIAPKVAEDFARSA